MAAPNFSGDGQQKTVRNLTCLLDMTSKLHGHLTFLKVSNTFMSATAFLGDAGSDPNCSSQGVCASSAVQNLASLSYNN